MELSSFERLKEEQRKVLEECYLKISNWKKYKTDYISLQKRLHTLPNKTSYNVMVPFGSLAFMPGKLLHTNEILVLLGDNWFAECSAKHANEIIDRRIKEIDKNLEEFEKERKLFEDHLRFTSEVSQESAEVQEEYDSDEEKKWREQHKKKVISAKKQEAEIATKKQEAGIKDGNENMSMLEKSLWARLDELERLEEELDEQAKLSEDEKSDVEESVDKHPEKLKEKLKKPKCLDLDSEPRKTKVKWKGVDEKQFENDDLIEAEVNEDLTARIIFKHSPHHNESEMSASAKESDDGPPVLQSPSDIYKLIGSPQVKCALKSILKHDGHSGATTELNKDVDLPSGLVKSSSMPVLPPRPMTNTVFSEAVIERNVSNVMDSSVVAPKRTVSKFKASRQNTSKVSNSVCK